MNSINRLKESLDEVIARTKRIVEEMKARAPGEYEGPPQAYVASDFDTDLPYLEDLRRRAGTFTDDLQADIARQCDRFPPILDEVDNIIAGFSSTGRGHGDLPEVLGPSVKAFRNTIRGIQTFDPSY